MTHAERYHETVPPSVKGMIDLAKRSDAEIRYHREDKNIPEVITLMFIDGSMWQAQCIHGNPPLYDILIQNIDDYHEVWPVRPGMTRLLARYQISMN